MSVPFVTPLSRRTLSAVYRFYDAFLFPIEDRTPPISSPLDVSIPDLRWSAFRVESDSTYRFSSSTLTEPPPAIVNRLVEVVALNGDYISLDQIKLTLPRLLSTPPTRADFLISRPLWPTVAMRPPALETAVRGHLQSASAQPVEGLTIEMWVGPAVTPPPGTPFTQSDVNGDFLFRFPLLKGVPGSTVPVHIRLNNGAIAVTPASPPIVLGVTQILQFQRT